jgi:hypothetical protein
MRHSAERQEMAQNHCPVYFWLKPIKKFREIEGWEGESLHEELPF